MSDAGEMIHRHSERGRTTVVAALSAATAASVTLAIGVRHIWPEQAWLTYVFKPLSTTLLVAIAAAASRSVPARHRLGILVGLVFSLSGDVLLMLPGDHFLAGLVGFLLAHLSYTVAFTSDCRLGARRAPFALWGVVGTVLVASLAQGVPASLFPAVILYAMAILTMVSQATARALALRDAGAVTACAGATLFVLSDSLLATSRFGGGLPWSDFLVLGPYFSGQWLIAVSVTFCSPVHGHITDDVPPP